MTDSLKIQDELDRIRMENGEDVLYRAAFRAFVNIIGVMRLHPDEMFRIATLAKDTLNLVQQPRSLENLQDLEERQLHQLAGEILQTLQSQGLADRTDAPR